MFLAETILLLTSAFRGVPDEMIEAAELDGCNDLQLLWSVVLPLSKPIIAVLALMYAISQWNGYFDALLYLKSADLQPLQLVLRNILILNTDTMRELSIVENNPSVEQTAFGLFSVLVSLVRRP